MPIQCLIVAIYFKLAMLNYIVDNSDIKMTYQ